MPEEETLRVTLVVLMPDCVTPSDHVIENGATPVSVALIVAELPAQIAVVPLTTADGCAFIVTTTVDEFVQPFAAVRSSYVPATVASIEACVATNAPSRYQLAVTPAGAVSVTLLPGQIAVEPDAVMVASGSGVTVTSTSCDCAGQPFAP